MTAAASRALRWLTLAVVVGNVAWNQVVALGAIGGRDVGEVSAGLPNLFTPAPYAFAIWGVIYLAFIAFAIAAVLPRNAAVPTYDRLAPPLLAFNALAAGWLLAFQHLLLPLSMAIIVAMLAVAIVGVRRAEAEPRRLRRVPFALALGWISVATIANAAALLVWLGWRGAPLGEPLLAILMIAVATLLALAVARRFADPIVPLVVAWSTIAIAVARRADHPPVAIAAVVAAALCLVAAGVILRRLGPASGAVTA